MKTKMTTDTILVTGGSGLVGKHLKEIWNNPNVIYLSSKDYDLTDSSQVRIMFKHQLPKAVIHLAAQVGGIMDNIKHPVKYFTNNVKMDSNILHWANDFGTPKVISMLSTCIYPDAVLEENYPMKEELLHLGPPTETNFSYGYAKRCTAVQMDAYKKEFGSNFQWLAPCNLYGECFSEDTEILTPEGKKNIKNFSIGDSVYTLNPETKEIEIEKIIATQELEKSEFFNFKGVGVDLKVTPEHKIHHKTSSGFIKRRAEYFREKAGRKYGQITFDHQKAFEAPNENKDNTFNISKFIDDDHIVKEGFCFDSNHIKCKPFPIIFNKYKFSSFLGWYISEGSYCTATKTVNNLDRGQIRISQNKSKSKENYQEIDSLLKSMSISYGKDVYSFFFSSRLLINYIKEEIGIGSENKKIPKYFFDLNSSSQRERKLLYESLMKGDGDKRGARYTTKSNQLKDDFIHLCFLLGIKTGKPYIEKNCWRIPVREKRKNTTVKYKNIEIEKVEKQKVYCITTEKNHIVYAGRNDVFNWVGQCDNFEHDQKAHFITALVKKIDTAVKNGDDSIQLLGTGTPLRQFMHAEDLARVIIECVENDYDLNINVAPDWNYSIREMAEIALKACDAEHLKINFDTSKPDGQYRKDVSNEKFRKIFPKFEFTSLEDGIKRVYEKIKPTD